MKLAARTTTLRCAFCHDPLGSAVLTCVACRTLIHEECELDRCPTLGCGSYDPWLLVVPPRPRHTKAWIAAALVASAVAGASAAFALGNSPIPAEPTASADAGDSPGAKRGRDEAVLVSITGPSLPARPVDAWDLFRPGAKFVTRTTTSLSGDGRDDFICTEPRRGAPPAPPAAPRPPRWRRSTVVEPNARHILRSRCPEEVLLHRSQDEVLKSVRLPRGTTPIQVDEYPFRDAVQEGERLLPIAWRRFVSVDVPAGRFVCDYTLEVLRGGGDPEVVEVWSDPRLPVPIRILRTRATAFWTPGAPAEHRWITRETVLAAVVSPSG